MKKKNFKLWDEFKAFISKGSVIDMAIGVIMGSAFGAIVTAFTNILLSICTWQVPGGLKGLYTVLPAANSAQAGIAGIGQKFAASNLTDVVISYATSKGAELSSVSDPTYLNWQNDLLKNYTLKGTQYIYNQSAVIDWGTFINTIISFLIIALTLFIILKIYTTLRKRNQAFLDKLNSEQIKAQQLEQEKIEKENKAKEEQIKKEQEEKILKEEKRKQEELDTLKAIRKLLEEKK